MEAILEAAAQVAEQIEPKAAQLLRGRSNLVNGDRYCAVSLPHARVARILTGVDVGMLSALSGHGTLLCARTAVAHAVILSRELDPRGRINRAAFGTNTAEVFGQTCFRQDTRESDSDWAIRLGNIGFQGFLTAQRGSLTGSWAKLHPSWHLCDGCTENFLSLPGNGATRIIELDADPGEQIGTYLRFHDGDEDFAYFSKVTVVTGSPNARAVFRWGEPRVGNGLFRAFDKAAKFIEAHGSPGKHVSELRKNIFALD